MEIPSSKVVSLKMMRDVDAAWLAAAIDGEGTITFVRRSRSVKISISNNSKEFLDRAKEIVDGLVNEDVGGISERKLPSRKMHHV